MSSGDYHVKIAVKNGRLLRAIRNAGYPSVNAFCRFSGLSQPAVARLLAMKVSGKYKSGGNWTKLAYDVADALNCVPDDLFNEQQATTSARQTSFEIFTDAQGIAQLSGSELDSVDAKLTVAKLLETLNPREREVCRLRLEGATYGECSDEMGFSVERARQLECKAMRKMRSAYHNGAIGERDARIDTIALPKPKPPPNREVEDETGILSHLAKNALRKNRIWSPKQFVDTGPHELTDFVHWNSPDRERIKSEITAWADTYKIAAEAY